MKSMDHEKLRAVVFSKEQCELLIVELEKLHEARWVHRPNINSRPTKGTTASDYYFLGDRQQTKEFNTLLRGMAPAFPGLELIEACVNRYPVNGYMPEHIDAHTYRKNMVVALNEDGDGIEIEGCFYTDVQGESVTFGPYSLPHAVPPVKNKRYVVIYLYD